MKGHWRGKIPLPFGQYEGQLDLNLIQAHTGQPFFSSDKYIQDSNNNFQQAFNNYRSTSCFS